MKYKLVGKSVELPCKVRFGKDVRDWIEKHGVDLDLNPDSHVLSWGWASKCDKCSPGVVIVTFEVLEPVGDEE